MLYQIFPPSEILKPFIRFYWVMESDSRIVQPGLQRIIPNGCPCLMFHYGDPVYEVKRNDVLEVQASAVLSGQVTTYYDVGQQGVTGFISLVFEPHALKMFFEPPPVLFTNSSIDLSSDSSFAIKDLTEQIGTAPDTTSRIALINTYLIQRLANKHLYNFRRIDACIRKIRHQRALVRVGDLAETACLSSRQFDRVFKEFTGIGTKEFLRIVRLQHVFHRAYNSDNENLTTIAHACGYYDQAHFNHEFREYTGSNPSHTLTTCSTQSDFFLQV